LGFCGGVFWRSGSFLLFFGIFDGLLLEFLREEFCGFFFWGGGGFIFGLWGVLLGFWF
jgi:hypothetical protein